MFLFARNDSNRNQPFQPENFALQCLQKALDLTHFIIPAQADAHCTPRQFTLNPHGQQYRARVSAAAGTG
jgi:hypothetical protein